MNIVVSVDDNYQVFMQIGYARYSVGPKWADLNAAELYAYDLRRALIAATPFVPGTVNLDPTGVNAYGSVKIPDHVLIEQSRRSETCAQKVKRWARSLLRS